MLKLQKSETSAKLENIKNTNKITVVNKQPSKLCIASQVNQTTDRDYKVYGAIALQLVRALSLNGYAICKDLSSSPTYEKCSLSNSTLAYVPFAPII